MTFHTLRCELADGVATVTFDAPDSPVNTMSRAWQADMIALAQHLSQERMAGRLNVGVVLTSAKRSFFAGADLRGVLQATSTTEGIQAAQVFREVEGIKAAFRTVERLGVPVVACLNGSALGGGWELALVAQHRVACRSGSELGSASDGTPSGQGSDSGAAPSALAPSSQAPASFGTPEVTLGLIPGAGGITKMTRLLGLQGAWPFLVEGRRFGVEEGLRLGLIHKVVGTEAELLPAALAWLRAQAGAGTAATLAAATHPWDQKDWKVPGGLPSHPKVAQWVSLAPATLRAKTHGLYPAPEAALAAMVEGLQVDVDTALRIESRWLARMLIRPVAHALIHYHFDRQALKRSGTAAEGSTAYLNRLQAAYVDEGLALLRDGVPRVLIENAARLAGLRHSPLEVGGEGGAAEAAADAPYDAARDAAREAPHDASPAVRAPARLLSLRDIQNRLLDRVAQEAHRCRQEGLVGSTAEGNVWSVEGFGFPTWTGGALRMGLGANGSW